MKDLIEDIRNGIENLVVMIAYLEKRSLNQNSSESIGRHVDGYRLELDDIKEAMTSLIEEYGNVPLKESYTLLEED